MAPLHTRWKHSCWTTTGAAELLKQTLFKNRVFFKCHDEARLWFLKVFSSCFQHKIVTLIFYVAGAVCFCRSITLFMPGLTLKNTRGCPNQAMKGKDQYSWPPCTSIRSAALDIIAQIIFFFTKQVTLMRRSTVLSLHPSVSSCPSCYLA